MKKLFCARTDAQRDGTRHFRVHSGERPVSAARPASARRSQTVAPQIAAPPENADENAGEAEPQRRSLSQRLKSKLSAVPARSFADTMDAVIPAVVVLRMTYVRAYDGNGRGASGATGFVIDKERGLILTNRHVVTGAPMTADATFQSKEEVELTPVYSDPIHDWGLFRFDPSKVKFQQLVEIPLAPERARVGVDIRVCGNDAGERLAILSGTLARLDRNAPLYGGTYSDHNTFYLSAASNTSGGSSGSPVVDAEGFAVGLNAGGAFLAASSFYLPLDRIVKALPHIQRGQLPPRRTIQTVFTHQSFVEVQRLGVPDAEQAAVRKEFKDATGMLVVSSVVPESAAEAAGLEPGDVLLRMQGRRVVHFVALEELMDDCAPDAPLHLQVQRGAAVLDMRVLTDDLHALSPTELLDLSDGSVHALSYMQAVSSQRPPGSVVVAQQGFMFQRAGIPGNVVIKAVGDQPTPDLDSFARELAKYASGDRVSVSFTSLMDKQRKQVKSLTVDRRWYPWARRVRTFVDGAAVWEDTPWPGLAGAARKSLRKSDRAGKAGPRVVHVLPGEDARLCKVNFFCPWAIAEAGGTAYLGCGAVVDAAAGIVLVDRNTVPCTLGDVTVTLAGTLELPAHVLMVHPAHNFALVQYDASKVRVEVDDAQAPLAFDAASPVELQPGMETTFRGFMASAQQVTQRATVTLVRSRDGRSRTTPRGKVVEAQDAQQIKNQTVIQLDKLVRNVGGALLDEAGRVQAFWLDFGSGRHGVAASTVLDAVARFRAGDPVRSLAVEFGTVPLASASAGLGLSDRWLQELAARSSQREILSVTTVMVGSRSEAVLSPGDMVLAIDGAPVADFRGAELATADSDEVQVTVLRDGAEQTLRVPTTQLPYEGTDRVVVWCGCILQAAPLDMAFRGSLPRGVYCANRRSGSPSGMHGMRSRVFITRINDADTPDLDSFCAAVARIPHGAFVRVRQASMEDKKSVVTIRTDDRYWPLEQMRYDHDACRWDWD